MIGGADVSAGVRASAREMLASRGGTGERRIKGKSERRNRANRHEVSDRNLRLPDERARLRAHGGPARTGRLRDDARRRRCRRHRHQHVQRAGARRGETVHAARRDPAAGSRNAARVRSSPSRAASRSRKVVRSSPARRAVDVIIGTQNIKRLPMLVDAGGRARRRHGRDRSTSTRSTTCRSRSASRAAATPSRPTSPSSKAAMSSAPSASCPTRAGTSGCGPSPRSSTRPGRRSTPGAREIQLLGQIVNHYQAPDDPACDFAELLDRLNDIEGLERIRFASPHPRHVTPRMIEAMRNLPKVCRHLHLPVQSGSTRLLAAMRRRYTRESYLRARRRAPRRHAGHRALDRYDRRVRRRDRRRLRRTRCR